MELTYAVVVQSEVPKQTVTVEQWRKQRSKGKCNSCLVPGANVCWRRSSRRFRFQLSNMGGAVVRLSSCASTLTPSPPRNSVCNADLGATSNKLPPLESYI